MNKINGRSLFLTCILQYLNARQSLDACCMVMFPFVLLANSSIRLNHSRILVQNEEFFPKVCTNAKDRRTITRIHSRSWAGFSIATDETERDLKAVACQQVQHSSWRASFPDARTLAISRGFLASAIPVVTHETLEVSAHGGVRRKCTPDLGCMSCTIAPRIYVDVLICAPQITLRWMRAANSRCDITCQDKMVCPRYKYNQCTEWEENEQCCVICILIVKSRERSKI